MLPVFDDTPENKTMNEGCRFRHNRCTNRI